MGRTRDVSKILTSNTSILSLASASATYATKATTGLTLINNTSFTGQSTVSVDNVFSATYTNYRILTIHSQGNNQAFLFRLRVGGVDASGSNYNRQQVRGIASNASSSQDASSTFFVLSSGDSTFGVGVTDIFRPFETERTKFISIGTIIGNITIFGADHSLSTSYDGVTFFGNLGTITGTIRVYGYRN